MNTPLPRLLLVEPQFVLRRTIVTVARNLGVVDFQEANNLERARTLLLSEVFQGLVMDLQQSTAALALLGDLRMGKFASQPDVLVVVTAANPPPDLERHLQEVGVRHVLGKPFKISDLLQLISATTA
jgi:CheY-like chemotaxis protein